MRYFIFPLLALILTLQTIGQPVIRSFSPTSGPVGTVVTISGNNFDATPSANIVTIGGVRATVGSASTTSLTVTVPAGGMYLPISVTTNQLTAFSSQPFIFTFSGASPSFTPGAFEPVSAVDSVSSDIETTKYCFADIDNDGKIDVLCVDRLNNTLSYYRNTTTGGHVSFAAKMDYPTLASPRSVSAGDIDGDGLPDVVVSNLQANSVSVFKNTTRNGSVSFAPAVSFATAVQPSGICISDLDDDGRPDLIINTINTEGYVSILKNTSASGNISFAPKMDVIAYGGSIEYITTGDFDGDGKTDIAVPNFSLATISIFRNTSTTGTINFAAKTDIRTPGQPYSIAAGDLNKDGKSDLVVTYSLGNDNVSLFRSTSNNGTISFATRIDYNTDSNPDDVVINDLDGDGKPDIAICGGYDVVYLLKNYTGADGLFNFGYKFQFPCLWIGPVRSGDFDGDGKPDLGFSAGTFRVSIWKNKTTEPYISSFTPTEAVSGSTITITGVNFTGVDFVSFGGVPARSFQVESPTKITAIVDSGATGAVVVSGPHGSSSHEGLFYYGVPTISNISPDHADVGTTVTINGTNFLNVSSVSFGGVPAGSFTVNSPTSITAKVGSGASGAVTVTTPGGTANFPGFIYTGPAITSFTPAKGGTGTTITIKGQYLTGIYAVSFGGTAATSFTVVNDSTINATVGTGASGQIRVTGFKGSATLPGFEFIGPKALSFAPTSGNTGTTIIIRGHYFTGTTAVTFGKIPAQSFEVTNDSTLTVVIGAGSTGSVSVTTPYGNSVLPGFIFTGPPVITSFSPAAAGPGSYILITGAHFTPQTTGVSFGGSPADSISVISDDSLIVVVGAGSSGPVAVTTTFGTTSKAGFQFIPIPKINFFTPETGPVGTTVTLTGENFDTDPAKNTVYFGAVKAIVTKASSTSLTVMVPYGTTYQPVSVLVNGLTAYSSKPFITTFPNNGNIGFGPESFSDSTKISVPTNLRELGIGDLDDDGKPDIAITNQWLLGVSTLRNSTTGHAIKFDTPQKFGTGEQGTALIIKDLDGDAKPELVVSGQYYIYLFRNTSIPGIISFTDSLPLAAGNQPASTYAADLDGDGKPEIITSNYSSASVSVLRNLSIRGQLSFAPKKEFSLNGGPSGVSINDMDGDGKPDIVLQVGSSIAVLKNTSSIGKISFATPVYFPAGTAEGLSVGDIDGDGKPDVVTVNYYWSNDATIFRNTTTNGVLSFESSTINTKLQSPNLVTLGDVNGDGKIDMAFTNGVFVALFSNTSTSGHISFGGNYNYLASNWNVVFADLDADGRPDIASQSVILRNLVGDWGISSFTPASARTGDTVIIHGTHFTGVTAVQFGGTPASSFKVIDSTTIMAIVGNGASGNISVTASKGIAIRSGFTYTTPPAISSFTPMSALPGATIIIEGQNFTGTTSVQFGGIPASSFTVVTPNKITAVLGSGASGDVKVTTPYGTAVAAGFQLAVVTAIDPVTVSATGIRLFPNPASGSITLDSLKLSDHWQTAEIIHAESGQRVTVINIRNQTRSEVLLHSFSKGSYVMILRRKQGKPVLIKFEKL